ncbi:hypothetical protein EJ08DRAFT_642576 [Tothia fuscella]|uniref:Serine hydrolase domain-containing protein n=1 Tax=Tothia fuscella TaxID=1048955 RepID=A0A9P4NFM4_9PEZI|nr:hypothetical protein EJ08DRAFT_642576 [Tothia fuscella]
MTSYETHSRADTPSKALLCLHGTGSNGRIFRLQMSQIRLALKDEFEFVFVDAPYPAPAGPGVLPMFQGADPFFGWFRGEDATMEARIEAVDMAVRNGVKEWESAKKDVNTKIVGVIAFSEGALVASLLLWQQQLGQIPWLPRLQFAVLVCCYFAQEVSVHLIAEARKHGMDKALINVPTLHVHGRRDFALSRARKLIATHYAPEFVELLEFDGGHQLPSTSADRQKLVARILNMFHHTNS